MSDETIVAVYDTAVHADAAVRDLEAINVPPNAITRHSGNPTAGHPGGVEPVREKGFWSSLFGGEHGYDETVYDRSVASGSSVVMVKVTDQHVNQVTDVLERHNPIDMEERAAAYGAGTGTGSTTTTTTHSTAAPVAHDPALTAGKSGEEVLALSEEQLNVGKRVVNRGTTRIRRFVVEKPVEEAVTLHSETVSIDRRPVAAGTKVADADFSDRTVEVTETQEEVVVGKTAHVREEVVINRSAADRVETVRDTVRREDVEITKDDHATGITHPGGAEATTTGTTGITEKSRTPDVTGSDPTRPGV